MRWAAITTVIVATVTTVAGLVLVALTPREVVPPGQQLEEVLGYLVLQAALTGVGGLLAWRRPENIIGWLLGATGIVTALQFATAGYAVYGSFANLPAPHIAAWVYSWSAVTISLFIGSVIVVFPDGRMRTRAGVAALVALVAGVVFLGGSVMLRPGPLARFPTVANPFGWSGTAFPFEAALAAGTACTLIAVVFAVAQLVARARVGNRIERQQLKWMIWTSVIVGVAALVGFPLIVLSGPDNSLMLYTGNMLTALATSGVPIGIAVAILRYRLYDIDLLINRTLVYGATSATLLVTYAVAVLALGAVLRPLTQSSELAVAGSTLAVAALIQPVRRRIQGAVDQRFYRARYDAERTVDGFALRLRDEVDLDALHAELVRVVRETVQPAHASLWLRERM